MFDILLPSDLARFSANLEADADYILDIAVMLNCQAHCSLCERAFVPLEPFVQSLHGYYPDKHALYELIRYNPYSSLSDRLCGFCYSDPGLINMFQKILKL